MSGLYLHIPFCRKACYYCDFHFSTVLKTEDQFVKALTCEAEIRKDYLTGNSINTIYFGGGTPSILKSGNLENIFNSIFKNYKIHSHAEITMEANPENLNKAKLKRLISLGINRLSIGMQSLNDGILKMINRSHNVKTALNSYRMAREEGFENISVDLIFGIPGLGNGEWEETLYRIIELRPEHISCYALTEEQGTAWSHFIKKGKITVVEDEIVATQMKIGMEILKSNHYIHYEISNFCLEGFESKHNSSYWKNSTYMGLGPSAHSYNGESRQWNISNNPVYIKSVMEGNIPFQKESLSVNDKINEYILTSLRTSWGCDLKYLKRNFGYDIFKNNKETIQKYSSLKYLSTKNKILYLTDSGKLIADSIVVDLLV